MMMDRKSNKQTIIRPQPAQEKFLSSSADVVFYGGAAGGGKTWSLLLEPLRHIHNPDFGAVIFRRTYPQITNEGGLWDTSESIYPAVGGIPKQSTTQWKWPVGSSVDFAHMQHEKNRLDWQGSQIPLICFDELTHFTWKQFTYMFSRNRSTCGVRPYIRATMNPVPPDDEVGGWIHKFVGWYIDQDTGYAIPEKSGIIRWFVMIDSEPRWADNPDVLLEKYPGSIPKSFTFIMSSVYDNQALLEADPGYLANLKALPLIEQEQLLKGNWLIRPESGKVFNRSWFEIVDAAPAPILAEGRSWEVRFWDLAATEKKIASDDPDFTASVKMRRVGDVYYILDMTEDRLEPAKIDNLIVNTASQDGLLVSVRWEQEGGASGKRDSRYITSLLRGYDARGIRPQGDKLTRARALSAQAYAGNIKLVRGPWNQRWLDHMHGQPDLAHDDIMDASSGAFNELARLKAIREASSHQG